MLIGYVSASNPFADRKAWSGTIYKIREAIELSGYEVRWIPYREDRLTRWYDKLLDYKERVTKKKFFRGVHSKFIARRYAHSIDKRLLEGCDYLFFPGGAQISLFLKTKIPVIYYADATVHSLIDYLWNGYHEKSIAKAKILEEKACQHSSLILKSSEWALKSTIEDCHADAQKCHVLKFGYNIDKKDIIPITPYKTGRLEILFSGVEWKWKGGAIAVETTTLLRAKGIDAHLTICGPQQISEDIKELDYVTYLGFFNKNVHQEYHNYIEIWRNSHLLILPTKAECAGIVFCEAAAFGMPAYTYATGGTTDYVINDYNGYAFPPSSCAEDFAQKIEDDIKHNKMEFYHHNALRLSTEELSWEACSRKFKDIMKKTIEQ